MKIVSSSNAYRVFSSTEVNAKKRKMNSSSPNSTHSSSQVVEHRNEVDFLDGTIDERDTNSPTVSFETAATDNVERGGCGLFIHQGIK